MSRKTGHGCERRVHESVTKSERNHDPTSTKDTLTTRPL